MALSHEKLTVSLKVKIVFSLNCKQCYVSARSSEELRIQDGPHYLHTLYVMCGEEACSLPAPLRAPGAKSALVRYLNIPESVNLQIHNHTKKSPEFLACHLDPQADKKIQTPSCLLPLGP